MSHDKLSNVMEGGLIMNVKQRGIYFVGLILLISTMLCFCSKDNSIQLISDEQDNMDSIISPENKEMEEMEEEEEEEEEVENENTSPWILISESSVDTKVDYAGYFSELIGITVGYAGEISYTEDGGESWSKSTNTSACRYGLDLYDESFFVSSGNSGVNLISSDKGESWSELADFPLKQSGEYNKFISAVDTKNIYVGSRLSLGFTDDGGETWKELVLPENCDNIVGMFFMTPEVGYLLNAEGTLYITKDACETWSEQTIDLGGEKIATTKMPSAAINFQSYDSGMIIYITSSYKIHCIRTEDGGSTWEAIIMPKVSCFAPYISRDGRLLTLSSSLKKVCLYKLEID